VGCLNVESPQFSRCLLGEAWRTLAEGCFGIAARAYVGRDKDFVLVEGDVHVCGCVLTVQQKEAARFLPR